MTKRMGQEHFFIPDTQVKEGIPLDHLTAAGNYIVDRLPDVIVHAGDHFDMPSLSMYDKGTRKAEGLSYRQDIEAGLLGMEKLMEPVNRYNMLRAKRKLKQYKPRMEFLLGNHEERIMRYVNINGVMYDTLSYKDLQLEKFGWHVNDFLVPVEIDGVWYSHYFYNPNTGRPYGGKCATRLNNIGFSFTMGHQQGRDEAEKPLANGRTLRGLIAGSFYQHEEEYKGPQGNNHWRGCIYKHEVKDGNYCLLEVSMSYLRSKWL